MRYALKSSLSRFLFRGTLALFLKSRFPLEIASKGAGGADP